MVHPHLECRRGVTESEEHDHRFEKSSFGDKGSFPLISSVNAKIIVSLMDIKFGKDTSIMKFVEQGRNQGKREGVLDCLRINESIILAWS
jgi:hypothetical protein